LEAKKKNKGRIKRQARISRYVIYKETLIDFKEHFWSFVGAFVGIGIIAFLQSIYLPKLENYLREKYALVKSEVKERLNYEIVTNPVDKFVDFAQENTKQLVVFLPKIIGSLLEWGLMIPLFLFFLIKDERRVSLQF
jgi:hypothetical protein